MAYPYEDPYEALARDLSEGPGLSIPRQPVTWDYVQSFLPPSARARLSGAPPGMSQAPEEQPGIYQRYVKPAVDAAGYVAGKIREPIDRAALWYSGEAIGGPGGDALKQQAVALEREQLPTAGELAAEAVLPAVEAKESYVKSAGRVGARLAADLLTDPLLAGLGVAGKIAGPAARLVETEVVPTTAQRVAYNVGRGAATAFVPGMVAGAVEGGQRAIERARAEGFTPPVLEEGLGAGADAAFAALAGRHALRPLRVTPREVEVPQLDVVAGEQRAPPPAQLGLPAGEPPIPPPRGPLITPEPGPVVAPAPRALLEDPVEARLASSVEQALQGRPGRPRLVPTEIQARDRAESGRISRRLAEMPDEELRRREVFYRRNGFAETGDLVREEMALRGEPSRTAPPPPPKTPPAPPVAEQVRAAVEGAVVPIEAEAAVAEGVARASEALARTVDAENRTASAQGPRPADVMLEGVPIEQVPTETLLEQRRGALRQDTTAATTALRVIEAELKRRLSRAQPQEIPTTPTETVGVPRETPPGTHRMPSGELMAGEEHPAGPREQARAALERRIAKPRDYELTPEQEAVAERLALEGERIMEGSVDEYGDPVVQMSTEHVTPERVRVALGPDAGAELVELVSRDAVRRVLARSAGRAFVNAMRKKFGDVPADDPNADRVQAVRDEEGDYAFIQRHRGRVVGAAQSLFGVRGMVAGGRPVGSPVRSRPLYDAMNELGIKPSDALSPYGKARQVRVGEYGGPQRVPERAGRPGGEPGPEVPRGPERGALPGPEPPVPPPPAAVPRAEPAGESPVRVVQRGAEAEAVVPTTSLAPRPVAPQIPAAASTPEEGTPKTPIPATTPEAVAIAGERADQTPSPEQMEAENYRKGHVRWQGLEVSIETPKGGTRRAKDGSWEVGDYPATYGYIKRTLGKDGDHVDVFLGDALDSERVFVIDQKNPKTGRFDEHKVMAGFRSMDDAVNTYARAYENGLATKLIRSVTELPLDEFKEWLETGDQTKPLAKNPGRQKPEVGRGRGEEVGERRPGVGGVGTEAAGPGPTTITDVRPTATPRSEIGVARRRTPGFGTSEREALDRRASEAETRREVATQAIVQAQKLEDASRYGTDRRARLRGKRLAVEESQRRVWAETKAVVDDAQRARLEDWVEDGDPGQKVVARFRLARRDAKGDPRRQSELGPKEEVAAGDMRRVVTAEAERQNMPQEVRDDVARAVSVDDGTVLTDGLAKVVEREYRVLRANRERLKAREQIEAMTGLEEMTGFAEKSVGARLKELDTAYSPESVHQVLFEAERDNEKGLERRSKRERQEAERAEKDRVLQESLREPVSVADVAALDNLTKAERRLLEAAREEDGAAADSLRPVGPGGLSRPTWSSAWDRLRERGLVERDTALFTGEGRRLARAAQRHADRLANGIPFSEYVPENRRIDPDAGGLGTEGGWSVATIGGNNYYSNGHILVRGAPPKARGAPRTNERLTQFNVEKALRPAKEAQIRTPVAAVVDTDGRRRVVFADGTTVDADYLDHMRRAHPNAEILTAGPEKPIHLRLVSGDVVATVMPVRWERAEWPAGVRERVRLAEGGSGDREVGPSTTESGKAFDGDGALDRLKRRGRGKAYDLGSVAGEFPGVMRDLLQYAASRLEDLYRAAGRMPEFAEWSRAVREGVRGVVGGIDRYLRRLWGEARALFRRRTEAAGERRGPGITDESTSGQGAQRPPPPSGPRVAQDLGYSGREVDRMRPEDVQEVLGTGRPASQRRAAGLEGTATDAGRRAQRIADSFDALNRKFEIAVEGAERVSERGTIEAEVRPEFRAAGQPERGQTRGFRFSERDIQEAGAEMVDAVRAFRDAEQRFRAEADPLSQEAMRAARNLMEDAVKRWQVYRSSAGRAVQTFNRPIPADVIQRLREAGALSQITNIGERVPITTNIINSLRRWPSLTEAEKRQFYRDLVDQYRLNLFSTTSFTLDLFGNAAEIGAQGVGGLAYDLIHVARGHPTFPSLQGFLRAVRSARNPPQKIADAFDRTVSGERLTQREGAGTFTYRSNLGSKFYDYLIGLPLYAKGAMDTAAKRFSSMAALWRDGFVEADRRGLHGADRKAFVDDYVNRPSDAAAQAAIDAGNKAGFNRNLSHLEEQIAESVTARLFVAPFARWPFQFTRWAAEMVGINPEVWGKIRRGTLSPEELGAYLARTATGLGGLYLLNQFYDRVDFNSMEYVDEDGNRIRLSGREPLATGFWLLAAIRAVTSREQEDIAKAYKGARYASVPFASLLGGDGGLLTSLVQSMRRASENQTVDTRAVAREIEDTINRAIPGQAVMAFVKTLLDPTIREGVGANLPGVSLMLEPAVNVVTGEPLEPRQKLLGVEFPSIGGTPVPGATRILEPVQKLLSRYGLIVYRGPRSPIAGLPPGEAPEELRREWTEAFGRHRSRLLGPLARAMNTLETYPEEKVRRMIQKRDAAAARLADAEIRARYGGPRKLPRRPSLRELAGPVY